MGSSFDKPICALNVLPFVTLPALRITARSGQRQGANDRLVVSSLTFKKRYFLFLTSWRIGNTRASFFLIEIWPSRIAPSPITRLSVVTSPTTEPGGWISNFFSATTSAITLPCTRIDWPILCPLQSLAAPPSHGIAKRSRRAIRYMLLPPAQPVGVPHRLCGSRQVASFDSTRRCGVRRLNTSSRCATVPAMRVRAGRRYLRGSTRCVAGQRLPDRAGERDVEDRADVDLHHARPHRRAKLVVGHAGRAVQHERHRDHAGEARR